jgi:dTDP-4-amino-4,6-dideoxygalactose transaminase
LADASELSFHPVKPITTAEGGAVVTNDAKLARTAELFRTHGITRDPNELENADGSWHYEQQLLGYNYRLSDVQAALGSSQLRRLAAFIRRRRDIAERYREALADVTGLTLPTTREDVESAWHLFVVRVADPSQRRSFFDALRLRGLGVQVHYIPVYHHPYYRDLGYRRGLCPVAEDYSARAVSLPIFPRMTDADVDRVVASAREVAGSLL